MELRKFLTTNDMYLETYLNVIEEESWKIKVHPDFCPGKKTKYRHAIELIDEEDRIIETFSQEEFENFIQELQKFNENLKKEIT